MQDLHLRTLKARIVYNTISKDGRINKYKRPKMYEIEQLKGPIIQKGFAKYS